jgi:hypothetical protein
MGKMPRIKMPDLVNPEPKRLWRYVVGSFEMTEDKVALLETACRSYDNFLKYDNLLKECGPLQKGGSGLIKRNPVCDVVRVERAGFLQALKDLDLETDADLKKRVGRPLGKIG